MNTANSIPETIATERLLLRRPRASDGEAVLEYAGDSDVTRYMDWSTHESIETVAEYLRECGPQWESGEEFTWLVTLRAEDRAIGGISCRLRGHKADFGYVLNKRFWRRGLGTEAARAVVDLLACLAGIHRIWATCDTENVASAALLERIGFDREGRLRRWAVRPNISAVPRDAYIYGMVTSNA